MALREYLVGEVAEDYGSGFVSRREALRRLGLLGVGLTSATALLAACGGDDDDAASNGSKDSPSTSSEGSSSESTAATTPPTSGAPVTAEPVTFTSSVGQLQAASATPAQPKGAVLVVHENRGLTPEFYDFVGRLATAGYAALCIDLLSSEGGTASLEDPAAAPAALAGMPMETLMVTLENGVDQLATTVPGAKIGVVGFCFGGGLTWELMQQGDKRIAAGVPFYGPAPASPDFSSSQAAVLAIYAGNDDRVNATRDRAIEALRLAGLTYEVKTFAGVDHAFFNPTRPSYNEAAAAEAYALMLGWFQRFLT